MKVRRQLWLGLLAGVAAVTVASSQASAQQEQKPNILFIMGATRRRRCQSAGHWGHQ